MSILLDESIRAVVQGITGRVGRMQTKWMLEYGTELVGGVSPGKGGQWVEGLPVYDTVQEAVAGHHANASVIFVPAPFAKDAALEAIAAGLRLVVVISEFLPVRDSMEIKRRATAAGVRTIGPNCPGLLTPGVGKLGIMPASLFVCGCVGIVARSATLCYEVAGLLTESGFGQSTAMGIGGDLVTCTGFLEILRLFEADEQTDAVVLVGEIGGEEEEEAASFIRTMQKPVVAFIAGRSLPEGKRFGHAGAIVRRGWGTAEAKVAALSTAGAAIALTPSEIPSLLGQMV